MRVINDNWQLVSLTRLHKTVLVSEYEKNQAGLGACSHPVDAGLVSYATQAYRYLELLKCYHLGWGAVPSLKAHQDMDTYYTRAAIAQSHSANIEGGGSCRHDSTADERITDSR